MEGKQLIYEPVADAKDGTSHQFILRHEFDLTPVVCIEVSHTNEGWDVRFIEQSELASSV